MEQYSSNLKDIVKLIRTEYPVAKCILITPSTVDPQTASIWEQKLDIPSALRSLRLPGNTLQYVEACVEVGRQLDVPVIDCFAAHTEAMEGGVSISDLFSDGVHYSAAGYDVSLWRVLMLTVLVHQLFTAESA